MGLVFHKVFHSPEEFLQPFALNAFFSSDFARYPSVDPMNRIYDPTLWDMSEGREIKLDRRKNIRRDELAELSR